MGPGCALEPQAAAEEQQRGAAPTRSRRVPQEDGSPLSRKETGEGTAPAGGRTPGISSERTRSVRWGYQRPDVACKPPVKCKIPTGLKISI